MDTEGMLGSPHVTLHHAELAQLPLAEAVCRVADSQRARSPTEHAAAARQDLLDRLDSEVLPHLRAEEEVLYTFTRAPGEGIPVAAMELDSSHQMIGTVQSM